MNTLIITEAELIIKGDATVQLRISAVLLRKPGRWDAPYAFRKVWQNRTIKYILAAHIMKQPKAGNLYDGSPAFCFHKNSV